MGKKKMLTLRLDDWGDKVPTQKSTSLLWLWMVSEYFWSKLETKSYLLPSFLQRMGVTSSHPHS